MRHHQHAVIRMAPRDVRNRFEHAPRHRLEWLAVRPARPAFAPPPVAVRKSLHDLVGRQTGPLADVHLTQALVELHVQPQRARDDLGGLAGPNEVRAVDSLDSTPAQSVAEGPSLAPALVVQRLVRVPLPAPLGVPVGLPVTGDDERRHGRR